jgi:hypothetical protein
MTPGQLRRVLDALTDIVVVTLIAAIIIMALALAARAQSPFLYIVPPLEYDYPYTGELTIVIAKDTKEVQTLCNLPTPRVACSYVSLRWCRIIKISDDALRAMGWNPLHIMRHEHAHCHKPDGWSNNHEGIRGISADDDARWLRKYDVRDLYRTIQPKVETTPFGNRFTGLPR